MDPLKLPIQSTFDQKGTEAAKRAVADLELQTKSATKATGEHSKEAKGLGNELESLGDRNNLAREAIEGVERASQGGAMGFFGLAKAARSLWEIVASSTPWGRIVGGVAVAGAALLGLREHFKKTGESAEAVEGSFGKAKSALEKLNGIKLDALKLELDSVKERASAFEEFGSKMDEITKRTRTARMNLELAEVNAATNLTPDQKKNREFEIRDKFEGFEQRGAAETRARKIEGLERQSQEAAQAVETATAARDRQQALVDRNRAAPGERQLLERSLVEQIAGLVSARSGIGTSDPRKAEELSTTQRMMQELLERLQARDALTKTDISKKAGDAQQDQLAKYVDLAKAASEAARAAEEALKKFTQTSSLEDSGGTIARILENKVRRVTAGLPETPSAGGTKTEVHGGNAFIDNSPPRAGHDMLHQAMDDAAAQSQRIRDAIRASHGVIGAAVIQAVKEQTDLTAKAIEQLRKDTEEKLKASRR